MSDLPGTPSLPAPAPAPARSPRARALRVGAVMGAVAVGTVVAALLADRASADGDEVVAPNATSRPVPVLAAGPPGDALSEAISLYGVAQFTDRTSALVLSAWGAASSDLVDGGAGGRPEVPGAVFVDDPRLRDDAGEPAFVDPCADPGDGGDGDRSGCPDDDVVTPAEVLGDNDLGANRVTIHAYPHGDVDLADECTFSDVDTDELALAVITANPGEVEVRVGSDLVTVTSDQSELDEFEAWRASEATERPDGSFVAHCLALPRPELDAPLDITAVAVDDAGQFASAAVTLLPAAPGALPVSVTAIDDTMVRVDVPLSLGGVEVEVRAVPVDPTAVPPCAALPPPAFPAGWRLGTSASSSDPVAVGQRPYLTGQRRVHRATVPVPEGQPVVLCVVPTAGSAVPPAPPVLLTAPDARRLALTVAEVELGEAVADGAIRVTGTFTELGWAPCGRVLPALGAGRSDLAAAGLVCASGGDTGAIAAAGGVLEVAVQVDGAATHRVRIPLSARPGGPRVETYRIPIPAPDLEGTLCTAGVDDAACVEPEGDAVVGSLLVTASWDEGPTGPDDWVVTQVPSPPVVLTPPSGD